MAHGFNFGMASPAKSGYQSPNRRLSQLLLQSQIGQPRQQRRGKTGQIADFIQSGLGAYLMSRDMGQQQAAQKAFVEGARGGDLKGATTALEGLSGNPYAQNRLQNLLMQQISQSQKEKQRLKELGSERETYEFQQKHKAFAPTKVVPGKDVPYSPAVQQQLVERAQAAKPSWGQMPGVPGMMVSSTGQMQAVPQTAQQKAQATLEAESAKAQAEAKRGFPQVQEKAQETLSNLKFLREHPGLPGVIGAPDTLSGAAYKAFGVAPPGTDEAGFLARLDQIGGQQFLQAFESLKGGGAITEVEGKKATEAMSRLTKTGLSEDAYRLAISDLENVVKKGLTRAGVAAGIEPQVPLAGGMAQSPSVAGQPISMPQGPQTAPVVDARYGDSLQDIRSGESSFPLESTATGYQPQVPLSNNVIRVQSVEEALRLPAGTQFISPDGQMRLR